jgi:hypothetical protein
MCDGRGSNAERKNWYSGQRPSNIAARGLSRCRRQGKRRLLLCAILPDRPEPSGLRLCWTLLPRSSCTLTINRFAEFRQAVRCRVKSVRCPRSGAPFGSDGAVRRQREGWPCALPEKPLSMGSGVVTRPPLCTAPHILPEDACGAEKRYAPSRSGRGHRQCFWAGGCSRYTLYEQVRQTPPPWSSFGTAGRRGVALSHCG